MLFINIDKRVICLIILYISSKHVTYEQFNWCFIVVLIQPTHIMINI